MIIRTKTLLIAAILLLALGSVCIAFSGYVQSKVRTMKISEEVPTPVGAKILGDGEDAVWLSSSPSDAPNLNPYEKEGTDYHITIPRLVFNAGDIGYPSPPAPGRYFYAVTEEIYEGSTLIIKDTVMDSASQWPGDSNPSVSFSKHITNPADKGPITVIFYVVNKFGNRKAFTFYGNAGAGTHPDIEPNPRSFPEFPSGLTIEKKVPALKNKEQILRNKVNISVSPPGPYQWGQKVDVSVTVDQKKTFFEDEEHPHEKFWYRVGLYDVKGVYDHPDHHHGSYLGEEEVVTYSGSGYISSTDPEVRAIVRDLSWRPEDLEEDEPAPPKKHDLTLNVGTGGAVEVDGRTVSGTRTLTFEEGTTVTLEAHPSSGYVFSQWTGDVTGTSKTKTFDVNSDMMVNAEFKGGVGEKFTLRMDIEGGGTTTPSEGSHTYDAGRVVKVSAHPAHGYEFDKWDGDLTGSQPTSSITMDSDKHVVAEFEPVEEPGKVRRLITTVDPPRGGRVTTVAAEKAGQVLTQDTSTVWPVGSKVEATAHPNEGYDFAGWTGAKTGGSKSVTLTMDEDKRLTAHFEKEKALPSGTLLMSGIGLILLALGIIGYVAYSRGGF